MNPWDIKAGLYHTIRRAPVIRGILDQEVGNLRSLLNEAGVQPEKVLDIGTGSGSSWELFPNCTLGIGMDRSRVMLEEARKRIPGLNPVLACALDIPVARERMVFVSVIGLSEYIRNKARLLDEVVRVLKPGGWLLITVPTHNYLNRLRNLLGSPLYIQGQREWESLLETGNLRVAGTRRSLLQIQYLLQRK
jgi:ubiquinone/menaquinone biosynthesis C-methylase UbiE